MIPLRLHILRQSFWVVAGRASQKGFRQRVFVVYETDRVTGAENPFGAKCYVCARNSPLPM